MGLMVRLIPLISLICPVRPPARLPFPYRPGSRRGTGPGTRPMRRPGPGAVRPYSAGFSESTPVRAFFHSPRVKSGISCGAPFALIDASLSGTGADQVAAS